MQRAHFVQELVDTVSNFFGGFFPNNNQQQVMLNAMKQGAKIAYLQSRFTSLTTIIDCLDDPKADLARLCALDDFVLKQLQPKENETLAPDDWRVELLARFQEAKQKPLPIPSFLNSLKIGRLVAIDLREFPCDFWTPVFLSNLMNAIAASPKIVAIAFHEQDLLKMSAEQWQIICAELPKSSVFNFYGMDKIPTIRREQLLTILKANQIKHELPLRNSLLGRCILYAANTLDPKRSLSSLPVELRDSVQHERQLHLK